VGELDLEPLWVHLVAIELGVGQSHPPGSAFHVGGVSQKLAHVVDLDKLEPGLNQISGLFKGFCTGSLELGGILSRLLSKNQRWGENAVGFLTLMPGVSFSGILL
jgi:hypothetical protein